MKTWHHHPFIRAGRIISLAAGIVAAATVTTVSADIVKSGDNATESPLLGPISLDPKSTYLRTQNDPGATDALVIDLAALGVAPGDALHLTTFGDYLAGPPADGFTDTAIRTGGVFSSSADLLDASNLNRIPDAIRDSSDGSTDRFTQPTAFDGLQTDIAEDFRPDDMVARVPAGSTRLFVCSSGLLILSMVTTRIPTMISCFGSPGPR